MCIPIPLFIHLLQIVPTLSWFQLKISFCIICLKQTTQVGKFRWYLAFILHLWWPFKWDQGWWHWNIDLYAKKSFFGHCCIVFYFMKLITHLTSRSTKVNTQYGTVLLLYGILNLKARTRQIIRYRATVTLRRPQIEQYTASKEGDT